jgi:regulator of protease activity HflC (stomatin/prohibitin superfamily)
VSLQTLVMVKEDMEGKTKGDDSVRVGSKEGQVMHADVSIQYSVERGRAAEVYSVWAGAPIERIEDNLVRQVTRSVLNDIASQYGWEEIYGAKRIEYTRKVSNEIARRFTEKHPAMASTPRRAVASRWPLVRFVRPRTANSRRYPWQRLVS